MKLFKKDLILEEDTTFDESIKVNGNIIGNFNLTINGNIIAHDIDVLDIKARDIRACDIDAWDIRAYDINALDIKALNIDAWDIIAEDIDASDIICNKRIKKSKESKTIARIFIKNKGKLEKKMWFK